MEMARRHVLAAGLGLALYFGIRPLAPYFADGELVRALALGALVAGGLGLYLILVIATGAMPLGDLKRFLRRG